MKRPEVAKLPIRYKVAASRVWHDLPSIEGSKILGRSLCSSQGGAFERKCVLGDESAEENTTGACMDEDGKLS